MIPEPYRIRMIEPIRLISKEQRIRILEQAGYNLFQVPAESVFIDFLTDSGTGAMSAEQWAGIMTGDESYAGARSFYFFRDTVHELFGFEYVLPAHQGRGAERVFFTTEVKKGQLVPSNAHFDTTRANLEWIGAEAVDLPTECANIPSVDCEFKGNIDCDRLLWVLEQMGDRIPFVMMTITNNRAGGQPVSMENLRAVSQLCKQFGKPLILDACRHAENAFFIQQRDPKYALTPIPQIVREQFSYVDGMLMSAKKDGLCNIGGFIAVRDEATSLRLKDTLILTEGFLTYGGLAGRDLSAMAIGLKEALDGDYLSHRVGQVEYLGTELDKRGVPVYKPFGGHAVYVDAGRFFEGMDVPLPGQSLASALFIEGGIRCCDVGSSMFTDQDQGTAGAGLELELMRLAIPRRTYTESHLRYAAGILGTLYRQRDQIASLRCVYKPEYLGHFTAKFDVVSKCGDSVMTHG